jgi:hypothetical protein
MPQTPRTEPTTTMCTANAHYNAHRTLPATKVTAQQRENAYNTARLAIMP